MQDLACWKGLVHELMLMGQAYEHMLMEPVPWACVRGPDSRCKKLENIAWKEPQESQDLGFSVIKIRNHENNRKSTDMPLRGLRIRPNRSPSHFLSIRTPGRNPKIQ